MDDVTSLALIGEGKINLRHEVVIDGCPQLKSGSPLGAVAEVRSYEPERVVVRADVKGAQAFLVLTGTYDPGWRVRVDGRNAPV